jgi:hypothetical protein
MSTTIGLLGSTESLMNQSTGGQSHLQTDMYGIILLAKQVNSFPMYHFVGEITLCSPMCASQTKDS